MFKKYKEKRKIDKVRKALVLLKETDYYNITSENHLYSLRYYSREIGEIIKRFQKHLEQNLKDE